MDEAEKLKQIKEKFDKYVELNHGLRRCMVIAALLPPPIAMAWITKVLPSPPDQAGASGHRKGCEDWQRWSRSPKCTCGFAATEGDLSGHVTEQKVIEAMMALEMADHS